MTALMAIENDWHADWSTICSSSNKAITTLELFFIRTRSSLSETHGCYAQRELKKTELLKQ